MNFEGDFAAKDQLMYRTFAQCNAGLNSNLAEQLVFLEEQGGGGNSVPLI